jgi:hypothetical protein
MIANKINFYIYNVTIHRQSVRTTAIVSARHSNACSLPNGFCYVQQLSSLEEDVLIK